MKTMNLLRAFIPKITVGVRNLTVLLFIACAAFQDPAFAVQLKTIINFNGTNGSGPRAGLVFDAAGRLYGTTLEGGKHNNGTVFQLTPPVPGKTAWTRKTLVNFNNQKGVWPYGELILDTAGKLYGTTKYGGAYNLGIVFQLTPPAPGQTTWTFNKLVDFNYTNGARPEAGLVLDAAGKLYGTTSDGGHFGYGTVFQLTPSQDQTTWTLKTLVLFNIWNGSYPFAGLVLDSAGKLYGTTEYGGAYGYNCGTVYQLTPPAPGKTAWTYKLLLNFNGWNGYRPAAGLVLDTAGKLYGTTSGGGQYYNGTVFQLTPPAPGQTAWTRKTLVNFDGINGSYTHSGLLLDAAGKLYGTTSEGGQYGYGTVFQLTPPAPGQTAWIFKKLVDFDGTNGKWPGAKLALNAAGKLYGTTTAGGKYGYGTVFQLTP